MTLAENPVPEIGLVSCVKTKREEPAAPRDLFISDYFRKMRAYVEEYHDDWWVLSAKYGLLNPGGEPIEPYDETLRGARVKERREWGERVHGQMQERGLLDSETVFVIHAGRDYYGGLVPRLEQHEDVAVELPTEGLFIGEKKAWYKERLN